MKELKLGFIKSQELAEWFNISYNTYRRTKNQRLEELKKYYAEFEEVYGGINITKILNSIYSKQGSKNYELIKSTFDKEWNKNGIDTCTNVKVKIYDKYKNELTVAESTAYNYVCKVRNELYGVPFIDGGNLGSCIYLWCKKEYLDDGTIVYTQFTDEEEKIRKDLMKKHFSTDVDKEVFIAEMVEAGEITKEQAYDALCRIKNLNKAGYAGFLKALKRELGCDVTKATLLNRNSDKVMFEDKVLLEG